MSFAEFSNAPISSKHLAEEGTPPWTQSIRDRYGLGRILSSSLSIAKTTFPTADFR